MGSDQTRGNHFGYRRIAGNVCLDFVNTLGGDRNGETREYLQSYDDLARWGYESGIFSRGVYETALKKAGSSPDGARETLERARTLRESLYRVIPTTRSRRPAPAEALFLIAKEASFAVGRAKIAAAKTGFEWAWPDTELDRVLWPLSQRVAEFVTSAGVGLVRECASERCTWLFLDTSKNHRRRWCDMKDCGNREKVRRFRKQR